MKPLILWGGEDVHPSFYEETDHPIAGPFNIKRDEFELGEVEKAVTLGQPVIGICRGAQLLCVFNGGTLWQHSIGHRNNSHSLKTKDKTMIQSAAADHHQIMRPVGTFEVLAWDDTSTHVYTANNKSLVLARAPEVVWWPKTKSLGIQPHPEWEKKGSTFLQWINKIISEKGIDYEF